MRIRGHNPNDMTILGIERQGLCCILVVNGPSHIQHDPFVDYNIRVQLR